MKVTIHIPAAATGALVWPVGLVQDLRDGR